MPPPLHALFKVASVPDMVKKPPISCVESDAVVKKVVDSGDVLTVVKCPGDGIAGDEEL